MAKKDVITNEIKVKIHEESDLYCPFDPEQSRLSEDVIAIWERYFVNRHRRSKDEYCLHVITDTPVNEENVRQKIRAHFTREKEDADYVLFKLTLKAIILGLIGAAFLAIWYFLSGKEDMNAEILLIIGWVGIWEAVDIFLMERPEAILKRFYLDKMLKSDIVITEV